jgi:hypothetical protein
MSHPVHPAVSSRYRKLLDTHRSILPPGELTAIRELESLDPHGLLSLAEEIGPDLAAMALEGLVAQSTEPEDNPDE